MKLENIVQPSSAFVVHRSACMYTHVTPLRGAWVRGCTGGWIINSLLGHPRKHPYHPQGGNSKLTPYPFSDVLIHLLLSETIFSPLQKFPPWGEYGSFLERPIVITHGIPCNRKFVLLYCAVGFENKKVFVANARGSWGFRPTGVYTPVEKSSTLVEKYLLLHTFSGFRIAIRGTSTVSEFRFLEY